jgi:hypothetical protein
LMFETPHVLANRVGQRFWLLGLLQAAHSIEEMRMGLFDFMWTATGRIHSWLPVLPQMRMTAGTFAVLNMGIIALLLGAAPFVTARKRWALALAWVAAVIEVLNGINHLAGTVVFRGYVPGAATAPLLLIGGIGLLLSLREERRSAAVSW